MHDLRVQLLRSLVGAAVCAVAVLWASGACAQGAVSADHQEIAQNWLRKTLPTPKGADANALRMEVVVGHLDSRLKLAPCGNVEPYLPVGVRLWGKTQVGLRCLDGVSRWNVMLPVTVNAYGAAWVIKGQVLAGSVLTDADVTQSEVNWSEETSPVLLDRASWEGYVATRALTTGQTLRQGMVKPAQVFQAGAPIRVFAQGVGFEISSDAQALSAGVVGQVARVRMENGRIASGTVLDGKTVQIDL